MIGKYAFFSACVASMYHDIQTIERVEMAKYGMKGPQVQCLVAMSKYPQGVTAAQLCTICEKDKAAISRIVAQMEQMGMLRREPDSRYRVRLFLTEQGRAAANTVLGQVALAVEQAGEGLTDGQREVFYQVLGQICHNLEQIRLQGIRQPVDDAAHTETERTP